MQMSQIPKIMRNSKSNILHFLIISGDDDKNLEGSEEKGFGKNVNFYISYCFLIPCSFLKLKSPSNCYGSTKQKYSKVLQSNHFLPKIGD